MTHSLRKAYAGWKCARCGKTYPTAMSSRGETCHFAPITVKGYDVNGRSCSVTYEPILITRVDVLPMSALIYTGGIKADLSISLKDYRRIKPLLGTHTKITGGDHV